MNTINWKNAWQQTWPHIVAVGIFVVLVIVYFAPQVFEGKQLPQSDMISSYGMGHDAKEYHEQTGEWSHWSNAMFGGMPYNATSGVDSKSLFHPIARWVKCGFNGLTSGVLWLLLIGFYIFMLAVGCSPWLSIVGAVAFAFGSYNLIIIDAGHVTKGWVLATMPAVIGGCLLCYRKKYIAGFIVTLIATGLNVYWNHQQISYYTLLMLIPLAISYFIYTLRKKEQKHFWVASCLLLAAAIMAVLPATDKLVPMWDYSKETMRGGAVLSTGSDIKAEKTGLERDYAFAWSYGKKETFTLLIPNFMGGSSHYPLGQKSETYNTVKRYAGSASAKQFVGAVPTYWGDQPFTSGPVYAGAIICFLAALGLLVVRRRDRWWLMAACFLGIFLAWGRNFPWLNNFLFDHLPLYNKFRTPAMALVITTTAMAMLGMLALKEVMKKQVTPSYILWTAGTMIAVCLPFALFPSIAGSFKGTTDGQLPEWLLSALIADRYTMLQHDAWRSILFIAAAAALLYFYLKTNKIKELTAVAVIGLLVLADLWTVDKHFLNNDSFVRKQEAAIRPTQNDLQILQDTAPDYRVLNLTSNTFNESRTSYFHKAVGGYSPAKLRRYQDIIDYYLAGKLNMNVLNMLNTRYVITRQGVQSNYEAFGNAWFVRQVKWVNSPNEEIEAIGDADLKTVAFIDTCWQSKVQGEVTMTQPAKIEMTNYANPGNLFYESESTEAGMAVFSEVYYKTWKALIDGVEVPVLRANYILRAIEVPAGKHTIEFRCQDELLVKTQIVSIIASWAIVLLLLLLAVYGIKRKKDESSDNQQL